MVVHTREEEDAIEIERKKKTVNRLRERKGIKRSGVKASRKKAAKSKVAHKHITVFTLALISSYPSPPMPSISNNMFLHTSRSIFFLPHFIVIFLRVSTLHTPPSPPPVTAASNFIFFLRLLFGRFQLGVAPVLLNPSTEKTTRQVGGLLLLAADSNQGTNGFFSSSRESGPGWQNQTEKKGEESWPVPCGC